MVRDRLSSPVSLVPARATIDTASGSTAHRARALLVGIVCALCAVHCDDAYPIAPTACDDYCLAIQRADCPEDWPEKCVSLCEYRSPSSEPSCVEGLRTLARCYERASDSDFTCVGERSTPRADVCEAERQALSVCTDPSRCDLHCGLIAEACSEALRDDCLFECYQSQRSCAVEAAAYLGCVASRDGGCEQSAGPCVAALGALNRCRAQNP